MRSEVRLLNTVSASVGQLTGYLEAERQTGASECYLGRPLFMRSKVRLLNTSLGQRGAVDGVLGGRACLVLNVLLPARGYPGKPSYPTARTRGRGGPARRTDRGAWERVFRPKSVGVQEYLRQHQGERGGWGRGQSRREGAKVGGGRATPLVPQYAKAQVGWFVGRGQGTPSPKHYFSGEVFVEQGPGRRRKGGGKAGGTHRFKLVLGDAGLEVPPLWVPPPQHKATVQRHPPPLLLLPLAPCP